MHSSAKLKSPLLYMLSFKSYIGSMLSFVLTWSNCHLLGHIPYLLDLGFPVILDCHSNHWIRKRNTFRKLPCSINPWSFYRKYIFSCRLCFLRAIAFISLILLNSIIITTINEHIKCKLIKAGCTHGNNTRLNNQLLTI